MGKCQIVIGYYELVVVTVKQQCIQKRMETLKYIYIKK